METLLFDRVARRNRTDPYDEKKNRGAGLREVQTWWKTCKDRMARDKTHSEPFIYDIKKLLKALSDKEVVAQSEVDAFMENCAKRWQTRVRTISSIDDKTHSEPFIYDIKKLLKALSDKEVVAQSEVDAFMENCAKRWQTRVRTISSIDVCQTFVTYLSTQERILTWRTSNNGQHGEVLRGGREHLRG